MTFNITLPCPVCSTKIPADSTQLVAGTKFSCPNCSAKIGLTTNSRPKAQQAVETLKKLRNHK